MPHPSNQTRSAVARAGAIMSDLVAGLHALVTENETGKHLEHRLLELRASADAFKNAVEEIGRRDAK